MADAEESEKGLKRTLSVWALIGLGIGAIIGAGLFVRTAAAAANNAGPSVTIAFIVAAIGCALAGLCYAEFASMIPIAGSAYTYSYATIGEMVAWIIGWDLVLEYAIGAATVSIAWSEYLNKLLGIIDPGWVIPYEWSHSPFEGLIDPITKLETAHGIMNLPALFIVVVLTFLLIRYLWICLGQQPDRDHQGVHRGVVHHTRLVLYRACQSFPNDSRTYRLCRCPRRRAQLWRYHGYLGSGGGRVFCLYRF